MVVSVCVFLSHDVFLKCVCASANTLDIRIDNYYGIFKKRVLKCNTFCSFYFSSDTISTSSILPAGRSALQYATLTSITQ
jgi:hypothetical protein